MTTTVPKISAYRTVNPFDNAQSASFDELSDRELQDKVAVAEACYLTWKHTSFRERSAIAGRVAQIARERSEELATLATIEMGKRFSEAKAEVELSANVIEYFARNAADFLAAQRLRPSTGGHAEIVSDPMGIILGIESSNFPYYQLARLAGPNLMVGNVVMVKHATSAPQCAVAFEKLWIEAGAPPGAYTNLFVSHAQLNHLIDDSRMRGVAFTGSVEAGRTIAARAAKNLKKTTMALGGSDAFIVLEDANLDKSVKWAVWGMMQNMGQSAMAAKRFIVLEEFADKFLQKFIAALTALKPGDPMDRHTTLGPLSTEAALIKLLDQLELAVSGGASVLLGGKRIDRPGAFMMPTILSGVTSNNPAFRQEFLGPVALFFRAKNDDDAVALANDSDFGLGGCIFTRDEARARRIANAVDTGMMFINHPTWTTPDLPFGGIKYSGYGRELSSFGIQEFVNKKLIRVANINAAP